MIDIPKWMKRLKMEMKLKQFKRNLILNYSQLMGRLKFNDEETWKQLEVSHPVVDLKLVTSDILCVRYICTNMHTEKL